MPKPRLVAPILLAFAACTPLLGLGDLTFRDGTGGGGGDAGPKPGTPLP